MPLLTRLLLLLPQFRRRRERVLDEELASYLDMAAEQAERDGLSPGDARYSARRDLGNMLRAKEDVRAEWLALGLEQIFQDLRFAARSLRKSPLFTSIAILTLALGIGAANAVFALVNGVLLKPLAYQEPGQLVYVQEVVPALSHVYPTVPVNFQHFRYWLDHIRSFDQICALRNSDSILTGAGEPEKLDAVETSAGLFQVLRTQMQRGRGFLPGEDQPGKNDVAVITDSLWRRRFQSADMVGHNIELDGKAITVVGVLPPAFHFSKGGELGLLAGFGKHPELFRPVLNPIEGWDGDYDYIVLGRLHSGVSMAQGMSELAVLTKQMITAHHVESRPRAVGQALQDAIGGSVRTGLLVSLGAVLVLLLIVCVNLANLMMARANSRVREFSVRTALGAGRRRLLQQLLTEALFLSAAGATLGMLFSIAAVRFFVTHTATDIPRLDEVHVDSSVMLFSLSLTLVCTVLFGLLPAYRVSKSDLQESMRASGHAATGFRQLRLREILVGCEVALSTILVFLAGLLISSLLHLMHTDKGFRDERAIAVNLSLPEIRYRRPSARIQFFERALDSVRALPGVQSAAIIAGLPLTGETQVNGIEVQGAKGDWIDPSNRNPVMINVRFVSPSYFEAIGIPVVSGRPIQEQDRHRKVSVISARLAAKVWPGQNPIGKKFTTGSLVGEVEVAGVVRDTYNGRLDGQPTLIAYVPFWIRPLNYGSLVVRSSLDSPAPIRNIQQAIWSVDSTLPVSEVRTMSEIVSEALAQRRFQMQLASAFGCGALMLALIGIYGVVAYNVDQRKGELGLRLALGARPAELVALTLKRELQPVWVGLACGLLLSAALSGLVKSLVFGVTTSDPLTMATVVVILGSTAFLACLLPAARASRMDPAAILRHE